MSTSNSTQVAIYREQVKLINDNTSIGLITSIILALPIIIILWQKTPKWLLLLWAGLMCATLLFRLILSLMYKRSEVTLDNVYSWERRFTVGALLTGAIWGAVGITAFNNDQIIFATFLLGGMAAGAISIYGSILKTYMAFMLPLLVPLVIMFFVIGGENHIIMAILGTYFIGLLSLLASRYSKSVIQNISLRFENQTILDELSAAHETLKQSEEYLRNITSELAEGLLVHDSDGVVSFMNPEAEKLLGWRIAELEGKKLLNLIYTTHAEDTQLNAEFGLLQALSGNNSARIDNRYFTRKNGEKFPVSYAAAALKKTTGKPSVVIAFEDITERKQAEKRLSLSEQRFRDVAMSSADFIWEVDKEGRYNFVSGKVEIILGYSANELIGKSPFEFMPEEEANKISAIFSHLFDTRTPIVDLESWHLTKNGRRICLLTNGVPYSDNDGNFDGYRGVNKDITDRKVLQEKLEFLAIHDPLTGLYNRGEMERLLAEELARSQRYSNPLSVMMLDIDHFKNVNDNHGHQAGDIVLQAVAKILTDSVRNTDYVTRYGGEEFLIILLETKAADALLLAERVRLRIAESSIQLPSDDVISCTISIGVSQRRNESTENILHAADKALYKAKNNGRNAVCLAESE